MSAALFFRHGEPFAGVALTDPKGRPYVMVAPDCHRCGGTGRMPYSIANGVCFLCVGARKLAPRARLLFTAERLAKLDEARAKALAKKAAAAAEAEAQRQAEDDTRRAEFLQQHAPLLARMRADAPRNEFLADLLSRADARAILSEKQIEAAEAAIERLAAKDREAATSIFIGEAGERIERDVTVTRKASFERPKFGAEYMTETVWITVMKTADGAVLVVKSASFYAAVGEAFVVRGTVKVHESRDGVRQTVLSRAIRVKQKQKEAA